MSSPFLHGGGLNEKYQTISTLLRSGFNNASDQYNSFVEYVKALYINKEGDLCIGNRRARLAGADTDSAKQYTKLKEALLINDGIIRFDDTFRYAEAAICEYSELYTNLFSLRYQYVFIDEYQDCSNRQRLILSKLFDQSKCVVIMIGDPDQAIYNSNKEDTLEWVPSNSTLSIASACRYNQEIAEILSPLRQDGQSIHSLIGVSGIKPVLIIYNSETIDRVIGAFISLLDKHGLSDPEGIYKIIGYIKNEDAKGLSIQSYWDKYDSSARQNDDTYWSFIDEICTCLQTGRLYKAEAAVRRLICRMFFFCGITNKNNGRRFHTASSIRTALNEKYFDLYSTHILELAKMDCYDRDSIHGVVSRLYDDLISTAFSKEQKEQLKQMPDFFIKQKACGEKKEVNNVFVEPLHKRVIQFDTVHGVKGETHDATLYLETEQSRSSDILRMLYCFGIGKKGKSPLYEYSRKVAYVGMSRPKTLLCVAMRDTTYQKGKNAFKDWDKLFLAQTQGTQEQIDN